MVRFIKQKLLLAESHYKFYKWLNISGIIGNDFR